MSQFLNRVLALTIERQNQLLTAFENILEQIFEGLRAAGGVDEGVETLRAESFTILENKDVYTHGQTGAVTRCLKIERRDRVTPLALDDVIARHGDKAAFLVNARSGRAALKVPAPGRMSEDGAVETCVRLLRPLESPSVTEAELADSHWEEIALYRFREAWKAERASLPAFRTSDFYLVTGLLLPIWDLMKSDSLRIYRLQTDDGKRLLGRVLKEMDLPAFHAALGLDAPEMSVHEIWASVIDGGVSHTLTRGLRFRRSLVIGTHRVEIASDGGTDLFDILTGLGCMTEIIQNRRRAFIPVGKEGPDILAKVLERFPLIGH